MTKMENQNILKAIKRGENEEVELRESFSPDFSRLISAFANTRGGMIIVGVNSKKKIIGVKGDLDQAQQSISGSAETVYPPLAPDVQVHEVRGKKVIVVVIKKADNRAFHTFRGAIYARVGSSVRKFEAVQLEDFLKGRSSDKDSSGKIDYDSEAKEPDELNENQKEELSDEGLSEAVDYDSEAQDLDGLNENQKRCIEFLKKHKSIKTSRYRKLNKVSSETAHSDVRGLLKLGYVKKAGSHRKVHYVLNEKKG